MMFIDTYIAIPLWIFGIFGFIYFSLRLFDALDYLGRKNKNLYTIVVKAKDQEDDIEGIVKNIVLKTRLSNADDRVVDISLVDLDSKDKTPDIMERLRDM